MLLQNKTITVLKYETKIDHLITNNTGKIYWRNQKSKGNTLGG